jgi:hypothetical protein
MPVAGAILGLRNSDGAGGVRGTGAVGVQVRFFRAMHPEVWAAGNDELPSTTESLAEQYPVFLFIEGIYSIRSSKDMATVLPIVF